MKVDVTIENTQECNASDPLLPTTVQIIAKVYESNSKTTLLSSVTKTFDETNWNVVQEHQFDISDTVANDDVYIVYEISAPTGSESDIFTGYEAPVGYIYLYPITNIDSDNVLLYADGGVYVAHSNYTGTNPFDNPELWSQIDATFSQGFVGSNQFTEFPDAKTYIIKGMKTAIEYAQATSEYRQMVRDFPNFRLKYKLSPGLYEEYTPDGEGIRIANYPTVAEVRLFEQPNVYDSSDPFLATEHVMGFVISRPNAEGTYPTQGDVGATDTMYIMFKVTIEAEVQNPNTLEWSIYNPRIIADNIFIAAKIEIIL